MRFNAQNIDRRLIYLLLLVGLCVPLLLNYSVKPARMKSAEALFKQIDTLEIKPPEIAFLALDFGPSTKAENEAQAEVVIEHLMRRRVPIALFSIYYQAEPFMTSIPERVVRRLELENPGARWEYGKDWVNLGYRPGAGGLIQGIPKSNNLPELFVKDVRGNRLSNVPAFKGVLSLKQIKVFAQFTGLLGALDSYLQFFQQGDYRPVYLHGCTSITIPESYIYMDSGQLQGVLEGIAGATWYSELLQKKYPARVEDTSRVMNTALGIAHLIIIGLILVGNLSALAARFLG